MTEDAARFPVGQQSSMRAGHEAMRNAGRRDEARAWRPSAIPTRRFPYPMRFPQERVQQVQGPAPQWLAYSLIRLHRMVRFRLDSWRLPRQLRLDTFQQSPARDLQ